MCDRVVSEGHFWIVYYLDRYKTQRMCEPVEDSLAALKSIPDWFVTSTVIKKLFTALYTDDIIIYFNDNSGDVMFSCK